MKQIHKTQERIVFETDMNIELANAVRRSSNEVPILAIEEVDIYKNDSALYDEVVANRLGLVPLKNQKLKKDDVLEFKLKAKAPNEGIKEVMSGEMGDNVVYGEMPIVFLANGQELELVAKAKNNIGKEHARHSPGLIYYKHLPEIKISGEGENQTELADLYPGVFKLNDKGKLDVKDAWKCDFDNEDMKEMGYKGIEISINDKLVMVIESWGQIKPEEIFTEACKALKANLSDVEKALK